MGVVLLVVGLVYIVGMFLTKIPSPTVENVAVSLNSVSSSGIGSGSAVLFIALFIGSALYLFLYLLAHQKYHKAIKMIEEKKVLMQTLYHSEAMKKELDEKVEMLLQQEKPRADIEVVTGETQRDKVFVMSLERDMEEEIRSVKISLSMLESDCHAYLKTFPNSLALLVSKLPECH